MAPQDVGAEACRIVGGDDSQPGFADPLDLDGIELLPLVLVEGVGIVLPALRDVFGEGVEDGGVADHDEIPRLTVAHARGGVRRVQQVGEFLLAQGVAGELGTHVAAALDDRFEGFLAVQIHAEDPSGNFLATSGGQSNHLSHGRPGTSVRTLTSPTLITPEAISVLISQALGNRIFPETLPSSASMIITHHRRISKLFDRRFDQST